MLLNRTTPKIEKKPFSYPDSEGYTLIEVLITMFILGLIILVVNIVFIALVRVSYRVDVRMKVRQNIEFALEMVRRSTKSAKVDDLSIVGNPSSSCGSTPEPWCAQYSEALKMKISETSEYVTYFVEQEPGTEIMVLKASWENEGYTARITSDIDMTIDDFDLEIVDISETGGKEILVNMVASSVQMETTTEPLVSGVFKQEVIITRRGQL